MLIISLFVLLQLKQLRFAARDLPPSERVRGQERIRKAEADIQDYKRSVLLVDEKAIDIATSLGGGGSAADVKKAEVRSKCLVSHFDFRLLYLLLVFWSLVDGLCHFSLHSAFPHFKFPHFFQLSHSCNPSILFFLFAFFLVCLLMFGCDLLLLFLLPHVIPSSFRKRHASWSVSAKC